VGTVDDRSMAYGHFLANQGRLSGIPVQNGSILDIAAAANHNGREIPPQDSPVPNAHRFRKMDIADQCGIGGNKGCLVDPSRLLL
jgi:hypothetical protein